MTIGQEEDDKAFQKMLEAFAQEYRERRMVPRYLNNEHRAWLRYAFNAGMQRGEEKRACCHGTAECGGRPDA